VLVNIYQTGKIGPTGSTGPTGNNGSMAQTFTYANVTGTSTSVSTSTFSTFYNITNSGFITLNLPVSAPTTDGAFWVFRNNTSTYLSITVTGTTNGITGNLLVLPPANSTTLMWSNSGSTYILF
jgi:hypothetical protein